MRLLVSIIKSLISYGLAFILILLAYYFVTGGYICTTVEVINGIDVDTGKLRCYFNKPLPFNLELLGTLSKDIHLYLFVFMLLFVPVVLLTLRDAYFQNKGVSQKTVHLKSTIWLVSPVLIIFSLLFIYGGWWLARKDDQIYGFILGALVGAASGIWMLHRILSSPKKQLQKGKLISLSTIPLILGLLALFQVSALKPTVYTFFEEHKLLSSLLMGTASSFSLSASLSHLFLTIKRRYSLL